METIKLNNQPIFAPTKFKDVFVEQGEITGRFLVIGKHLEYTMIYDQDNLSTYFIKK